MFVMKEKGIKMKITPIVTNNQCQKQQNINFGMTKVRLDRAKLGKLDDGLLAVAESAKPKLESLEHFNARFYITRDGKSSNFLISAKEIKKGLKSLFSPKIQDTAANNETALIKIADILSSRLYNLID